MNGRPSLSIPDGSGPRTIWRRGLRWGGSLVTGGGLVLSDPIGVLPAIGIVTFLVFVPTSVGICLTFAFGQLAVAVLLVPGSLVFIFSELGLVALILSLVPLASDRATRLSLGIGTLILLVTVGGVWLAVRSDVELPIVAGGLLLGGAILLYRVQRYERTAHTRGNE